jgi:hypothetical protein
MRENELACILHEEGMNQILVESIFQQQGAKSSDLSEFSLPTFWRVLGLLTQSSQARPCGPRCMKRFVMPNYRF